MMSDHGTPLPDTTATDSAEAIDHPVSHWKGEDSRQRHFALYRSLRARAWGPGGDGPPVTSEHDVVGRFGTTHAFEWAGDGVPVVFVHGAQASSIMWAPIIHELGNELPIYALDTPGDPGESVQTEAIVDIDDLSVWLDETLESLGIRRAHLVGASYGGWLLLHYAAAQPRRVASLALVEPVMEKLRPKFFVHGLVSGLAISVPGPQRLPLARRLDVETVAADPDARAMAVLAFQKHRRVGLPRFTVVPDDVIADLTVPTLALFGTRSPLHHADRVAERLARLNPSIETALIPKAGHTLPVEHPAAVASRLQQHLDR